MHIAVTISLIGIVFPGWRAASAFFASTHQEIMVCPLAVKEEFAMTMICLVFVTTCVRSSIVARRTQA